MSRARRWARPGVAARPPDHGVCTSRGGGGTSDSKALPAYPRDQHVMQATARMRGRPHSVLRVHVVLAGAAAGLDTAGCACVAGLGAAEAAAGLAGMRCGGRGNFYFD